MSVEKSVSQNFLSQESAAIFAKWEEGLFNGENQRNRAETRAIEWALWKLASQGEWLPEGSYGRLKNGVVVVRHSSEWVDCQIALPAHCVPVKSAKVWHAAHQAEGKARARIPLAA
ncbi:MAG: hypothetical protein ACRYHQ_36350 [Janthinobacterium lividum]